MRKLRAEAGQGGFDAEKLTKAPLVFIWIPVGILLIAMAYCAIKCAMRRRLAGMSVQTSVTNTALIHGTVTPRETVAKLRATISSGLHSAGRLALSWHRCCADVPSLLLSRDILNAVPRGVKNVLYYPSEFEVGVERVQQPQDDDRPLPRRTLARISHASAASGLPGSERGVAGDSSGPMLGITNAQLQKLQLADIANMLLPDRTGSIHSQSGGLPFVTVRSEGSASVVQDATSDSQATFGINDIYHDAISGRDISGPIDGLSSPSPVARSRLHSRKNSLSVDDGSPFHQPMGGRDPNRHVWSPMQPHSVPSPSTPTASRIKNVGKALRSPSNQPLGISGDTSKSRFAAAVDMGQGHDTRATVYNPEVDQVEPVDIEL